MDTVNWFPKPQVMFLGVFKVWPVRVDGVSATLGVWLKMLKI